MAQLDIVDGPSKFDLMVALFDGDGFHHRKKIILHWDNGVCGEAQQLTAHINMLEREDGSGENWNFKGISASGRVKGYFSTRTRKGWIEFSDQ